jgi:DNA-binding transcriptional LysR family regulator
MFELSNLNIGGLRAAEAVARLGSLNAASAALGVTPGAVSQQIIRLEAQLNKQLFERTPKGMVPTELGAEVAKHLTEGFAALSRGVSLARKSDQNVITVSVAPVFASKWLVRRLGRFSEKHPNIRVQIDASVGLIDPGTGEVDACIRVGKGDWQGVKAEEIKAQRVFPVCSPQIAKNLRQVEDLRNVPVIRERANGLFDWNAWLSPNGMSFDELTEGPVFSDAALCIDAAIAGQGIFLSLEALAVDALDLGQLVAPFPGRFPTGVSYWFVEQEIGRRPAAVVAFRSWLISEFSQDAI